MSLFNLSREFESARMRAAAVESELDELQDLICAWFGDSDPAARDWLQAIAEEHYAGFLERKMQAASDAPQARAS